MKLIEKKTHEEKVDFTVHVEKDEFLEFNKKAYDKEFRRTKQSVKIPGFRQGKAPDAEVAKYVDVQRVTNAALNLTLPKVVEFIESTDEYKNDNSETVDVPRIEILELEKDEAKFLVSYELYPKVTIEKYDDIAYPKISTEATDQEVENEIEHARKPKQTPKTDGKVENGDSVLFDFKGFVDGKAFEGGEAKDYRLVIGSKQFIPGFEDQMIGLKAGEEKTLKLQFPKDYHVKDLAGKDVNFEVKVNEIFSLEKPEFNEEFVSQFNIENVKTPEEFKQHIKNAISKAKKENFRTTAWNVISANLMERAKITKIPESLIKRETENIKGQILQRISSYNISLERYLEYSGKTQEEFNKNLEEQAEQTIKLSLVIDFVAEQNKLTVSDEQATQRLDDVLKYYSGNVEENRQYLLKNLEVAKEVLTHDDVIDFLINLNSKNEVVWNDEKAKTTVEEPKSKKEETKKSTKSSTSKQTKPKTSKEPKATSKTKKTK